MYNAFFGLQRAPFGLTPDPEFLYLTAQHREALAGLTYAMLARMGFVVLTGNAGTGKTLLLTRILQHLPASRIQFTLEEALVHVLEFPNLFVLSAGTPADNPVELLDSAVWRNLCVKVRSLFRYVVLDSPPMGAVADYDLIQAVCDGVMLVVRPDHTDRMLCEKSLETVPKSQISGCGAELRPGLVARTFSGRSLLLLLERENLPDNDRPTSS